MTIITTIGLDLAKKVFQVVGVDEEGKVVVARRLRRKEVLAFFTKLSPCLVGRRLAAVRIIGGVRAGEGSRAAGSIDAAQRALAARS